MFSEIKVLEPGEMELDSTDNPHQVKIIIITMDGPLLLQDVVTPPPSCEIYPVHVKSVCQGREEPRENLRTHE